MRAKQALGRVRAPGEQEAEERAWAVVRSAYHSREAIAVPPGHGRRFAVVFAAALALGAAALSPAGATVGRLITRALGVAHASPTLSSLPAPGQLLVSGPSGTWTVAADGALRRLGPWPQASWSPHARYLAVAGRGQLAAIDPRGSTRWTLSRPSVTDPSWYWPTGYRIAYLSGGGLRVLAGDGTGDHLLAANAADVAPAWRPGHPYQLAYLTRRGTLVVRDGDTEQVLWARSAGVDTTRLQWSADGRYLLALSPMAGRLYSASGTSVSKIALPPGAVVVDGALSPDGRLLALLLAGTSDEVVLEQLLGHRAAPRRVLAGPGLTQVMWAPDSRWLLINWPAANQWVFVHVAGTLRIAAISHIAQQFGRGAPQLEGWCCTAPSQTGS